MPNITSVSAHIFVFEPESSKPTHVLLQRRGFHDFEKDGRQESWPNALQPAAHGKLRPGEEGPHEMDRELDEELGGHFSWINTNLHLKHHQ